MEIMYHQDLGLHTIPYKASPSTNYGILLCEIIALPTAQSFLLMVRHFSDIPMYHGRGFWYLPCFCGWLEMPILSLKGHWTGITSSPNFFHKKVVIFIPLEVLAWVMTACWVLRSGLTYFRRNMNISSIFYFSKSTSINTQYSSLWDTLKMMLFTKYLIKLKRIGRISWNFQYWFNLNPL